MVFVLPRYISLYDSDDPLRYALMLRYCLELMLPFITLTLTVPLLAREWQEGTLTQVALRKPVFALLVLRLLYVMGYLTIWVIVGSLIVLASTRPHPEPHGNSWLWIGQNLGIALAPSLCLAMLAQTLLLIPGNSVVGYMLGLGVWLVNMVVAPFLQGGNYRNILLYLLFSWTQRGFTDRPDDWWQGKWLLLVIALLLMLVQWKLLTDEGRFIRQSEE